MKKFVILVLCSALSGCYVTFQPMVMYPVVQQPMPYFYVVPYKRHHR